MGWSPRPHRFRPRLESDRSLFRAQGEQMIDVLERRADVLAITAMPPKIDVRDLDFFYGKTRALNGVDLAVPENAVTAIIGPSGCGKSTLLRAINRIFELYPEQRADGEVLID